MCDPVTITAVGLTVAGGATSAYSSYQEGLATAAYNDYLSKQARQDAEITQRTAKAQSQAIQDTAAIEGKRLSKQQAKALSKQSAALAAAGVSGGSAENILSESITNQQEDKNILRYNADLNSWKTITDADYRSWALRNQADLYGFSAKEAKRAGKRKAFSTLLSTAGTTAFMGAGGFGQNYAIPGFGGYGLSTPIGTKNMGTWSKLPGK